MRKSSLLLALFALSTFTFVGCDSNDEDDYSDVLGRWEYLDDPIDGDAYLNITNDELVIHYFFEGDPEGAPEVEDCFITDTAQVLSRDGNEWTIRTEDDTDDENTQTLVIRRDGDELVIDSPDIADGDTVRLQRSTRTDFTPLCEE